MAARIDEDACVGCGACEPACPSASIQLGLVAAVDPATCDDEALCAEVCPQACIAIHEAGPTRPGSAP